MSDPAASPAPPARAVVPTRGAFVVGIARSGTSLLRSLLDGHPEAYVLPEETFAAEWCGQPDPVAMLFHDRPYGKLFPQGSEDRRAFEASLRDRLHGPVDVKTALTAVIEALAPLYPLPPATRVWVEKTPRHIIHVPVLMHAFGPTTRMICLVRDPRAVLASQNKAWNRTGLTVARRFCRQWTQADRLAHEYAERFGQFLVVRYEDLVSDAEASLRRVLQHLGLPFHESVLRPTQLGRSWQANSSYAGAGTTVTDGSRRRYHEVLSAAEIARVEELLGPRMVARGYELEGPASEGFSWRRLSVDLSARRHIGRRRRRWARSIRSGQASG